MSAPNRGRGNRPIARARGYGARGRGSNLRGGFTSRATGTFSAKPSPLSAQQLSNGVPGGQHGTTIPTITKRFGILGTGAATPTVDPSNMSEYFATVTPTLPFDCLTYEEARFSNTSGLQLKQNREKERAHAIANNLVDDSNKQRRLEDAIVFTGTCQDMCPLFERVERIAQKAVDGCEKITAPDGQEVVRHELMVKRFRRSAAGDEAQLPSDVRPPSILKVSRPHHVSPMLFSD